MAGTFQQFSKRVNIITFSEAEELLFDGAEEGDLNKIGCALRVITNVNDVKDVFGNKPLHYAYEHLHAVKFLIAQGADINSQTEMGQTMLHLMNSNLEAVKYLIDNGADINIRNKIGNNTLHDLSGYYAIIKRNILQAAEDEDETEEERKKYRDYAQCMTKTDPSKYLEVIVFLISKGMDVNIKNNLGDTPLSIATEWGDHELIKCLVDNGAK